METPLSSPRLPRSLATYRTAPRMCATPDCPFAPAPTAEHCFYCRALACEFDEREAQVFDGKMQTIIGPDYLPEPAPVAPDTRPSTFFDALPGRIDVDAPPAAAAAANDLLACDSAPGLTAIQRSLLGLALIAAVSVLCLPRLPGAMVAVGMAAGWKFRDIAAVPFAGRMGGA
jgi:hypothetical protein